MRTLFQLEFDERWLRKIYKRLRGEVSEKFVDNNHEEVYHPILYRVSTSPEQNQYTIMNKN